MKTRKSFVGNSSSCSFIVFNESMIPNDIFYVELNEKEKKSLIKEGYEIKLDEYVYLTEYVSDTCDEYNEFYTEDEVSEGVIEYHDGGHGTSYDLDIFNEIAENIWLKKSDEEIDKIKKVDSDYFDECPSCQSDDVETIQRCRTCNNEW